MTCKQLLLSVLICSNAPLVAFAQNVVVHNSSSINSVTSATASTGENHAGSGGAVTTGTASASAQSNTVINGSDGESNVRVEVETNANGEVHKETYDKKVEPGESLDVKVATSSTTGKSTVSAKSGIHLSSKNNATSSTASSTLLITATSTPEVSIRPRMEFYTEFISKIPVFFRGFAHLFWFW